MKRVNGERPLPDGWTWTTIKSVAEVNYGKGLPKRDRNDEGVVPVYGSSGIAGYHSEAIVEGPCLIIGRKGTAGAVHLSMTDCWPIDTTYYAYFKSGISLKYAFYALKTLNLESLDRSTAIPSLSRDDLYVQPFPLAPFPEQHRIVAEIEKQFTRLDQAVASLRRLQSNLARYKASVLKAACEGRLVPQDDEGNEVAPEPADQLLARILAERRAQWEAQEWQKLIVKAQKKAAQARRKAQGRPARAKDVQPAEWETIPEDEYARFLPKNDKWKEKYKEPVGVDTAVLPDLPEGWVWATMPQLGELNRGKSKHRPRNDARLFGGPYPFIQTGEIRQADGFVTIYSKTYSEFGLSQSKLWPKGTLCITIAANIAETAILSFDACFPDSVVGFIPFEDACDVRFVEYFIRTAKNKLEEFAPATAQKNINLQTLSELAIPLPPFAEQKRIVAEVERRLSVVTATEQAITTNLARAKRLRQSILHQAFTGQLVPQQEVLFNAS